MAQRGYARFYKDKASSFIEPEELRDAFDPNPVHRTEFLATRIKQSDKIDKIAAAIPWRQIGSRLCSTEVAHAMALDCAPGPSRLRAIISRTYDSGDRFADALAQDRQDRDFAEWATSRPGKKEQTLATLLDLLVGGGAGKGGSDFQPDNLRLFSKYVDGGKPWDAFKAGSDGLLRRAIDVIERDPSGSPGEADDLYYRAEDAIRCLDEVRDALLRRRGSISTSCFKD